MKKLSIIASLLLAVSFTSAQTSKTASVTSASMIDKEVQGGRTVPKTIRDRFLAEYPGEQPMWSNENGNYRALFVDGSKMYGHAIAYNSAGDVVYREEKVSEKMYPAAVSDYYKTNYPNEKYEVWAQTDKGGKLRYYSNHNLETLWFDDSGKFVQKSSLKKN